LGPLPSRPDDFAQPTRAHRKRFLDVRLQADTTTFPLADRLLQNGIPFIFQTSDPGLIAPTYASVPVLRKPFQPEQLLAKIVDLLAKT
jgi:hypothetical protein